MKLKIQAIQKKDMPSKFGGTWKIAKVKFEGIENPEYGYELKGFGSKTIESLIPGKEIIGYFSSYQYQGKESLVNVKTFNKITAEYVYDLLLAMNPSIEESPASTPVKNKTDEIEGQWETSSTDQTTEPEDANDVTF
jgi:hypothetical protein